MWDHALWFWVGDLVGIMVGAFAVGVHQINEGERRGLR